jgi:hypothetical protein
MVVPGRRRSVRVALKVKGGTERAKRGWGRRQQEEEE